MCNKAVRNIPVRFDIALGNFDQFRSEGTHLAIPPLPPLYYLPYPLLPYTTPPMSVRTTTY